MNDNEEMCVIFEKSNLRQGYLVWTQIPDTLDFYWNQDQVRYNHDIADNQNVRRYLELY